MTIRPDTLTYCKLRLMLTSGEVLQLDREQEWSTNYTVFFDIITPEFNASRNVADKEINIAASYGLPELTQNVITSLHNFPANFMQIGPAVSS